MSNDYSTKKDRETLEAIAAIYCSAHHANEQYGAENELCPECARIVDYATARTKSCPYNHEGNCQDCTIHCYSGEMRIAVKQMMRYSAPRMIYKHPFMALSYLRKKFSTKES